MIEIEKNVPIPPNRSARKYPIYDLEIGDSFFVEGRTGPSMSYFIAQAKKKTGHSFTTRICEGGVRVWRTA